MLENSENYLVDLRSIIKLSNKLRIDFFFIKD